jgi:hypothetical protein
LIGRLQLFRSKNDRLLERLRGFLIIARRSRVLGDRHFKTLKGIGGVPPVDHLL